ncbi:MAG: hypothetical protein MZV63_04440 [Marinilabiliales bacterium]|nr:hypothetical protein [Marinilabiliales bacterium]
MRGERVIVYNIKGEMSYVHCSMDRQLLVVPPDEKTVPPRSEKHADTRGD